MNRFFGLAVTALLLPLACARQASSGGDGHTTTSQGASETGEPSETSSSSSSDDDSTTDQTGDDETGVHFVPDDDIPSLCSVSETSVCDEIAQDCPEGEKCVPYAFDNCSYPRCVPITGDKQFGEPCTADEQASDDCDGDSWCYPGTLGLDLGLGPAGVCAPFCSGSFNNPTCPDPSLTCVFDQLEYSGVLGCRPRCDPLMPEGCEAWERCSFTRNDLPKFGCVFGGGVADGEVCSKVQDCDSGLCVVAEVLLECAGESCCSPWCDLLAPECALGLECVPVEVDDPESQVGVCMVP